MLREDDERYEPKVLHNASIIEAECFLKMSDMIIGSLIEKHSPCNIAERPYQPFHTLATSIIGQQLSARAAETIIARISTLLYPPFHAWEMLNVPLLKLRGAGISMRKAKCLHELAERLGDKRLSIDTFDVEDNEAVIKRLIELPGIGRWTAEMFLIFGLRRINVLSIGDAGLQRASRMRYGNGCDLSRIGALWSPFCSIASWYLWRHLDSN